MTARDYALANGMAVGTVVKMCRQGKIKGAHKVCTEATHGALDGSKCGCGESSSHCDKHESTKPRTSVGQVYRKGFGTLGTSSRSHGTFARSRRKRINHWEIA